MVDKKSFVGVRLWVIISEGEYEGIVYSIDIEKRKFLLSKGEKFMIFLNVMILYVFLEGK